MKIVAIVQARMGSTRFPGKVLKKIKNKPLIDYVIGRLKLSRSIDQIIIATSIKSQDDLIVNYAKEKGIKFFRGSEEDVLSRYYNAAKENNADVIVRITSDCPLIDPDIIDDLIANHIKNKADYTANIIKRTYPRGFDVEVFSIKSLIKSFDEADKKYYREHVTPYIREHPEKFKLYNIEAGNKLRRPEIRITVDTIEDFNLIGKIYENFDNIDFRAEEIIDFLDKNPQLLKINKHVKQKGVLE